MDDDRYDPKTIEAKWQRVWEDARAFHVAESRARRAGGRHALVPARDAAVPVRQRLHMGHVLNYTLGDVVTHVRRRSGCDGAAPDGLRRLRPAGRERRDPRGRPSARDHRAQHRHDPRADEAAGLGDRLGPRGLGARARVLPLDAVAVPEVLRARARLPEGGAGQLVPERPDRARERARRRRPLRALRRARRAAEHDAVVLQDHRVRRRSCSRRPAARRSTGPSGRRRSSATGSAAPRAPRSSSASTSSTWTSRSSRRGPTRCSARRSSSSRPSIRSSSAHARRGGAGVRAPRRRAPRRGARRARRRRPASSPATTRRTRSTASGSRSGSPTTC